MRRLHAVDREDPGRGDAVRDGPAGALRLWMRRSTARSGLLAATASVALLVGYLAVTIIGLAVLSQAPAVRSTLRAGQPQTIGVQAEAPLDADRMAQDAAARKQIDRLFPGVRMNVSGLVETSPIRLGAAQAARAGASSVVLMLESPDVRAGIRTVDGDESAVGDRADGGAASRPAPVAVQADAARRLGLAVGDSVTIPSSNGAVTLRVASTWRVREPAAPLWFGDQRVVAGRAEDAVGPFIVSAAVLDRFDTTPSAVWVVTPDAERTTPDDVPVLADGFGRLAGVLSADDAVTNARVSVSGDGRQTALNMQRSMAALAAVLPLPVAVLAVGTVLALVLLARLTADTRAGETTLLRARGASGALLVRAAAIESAAIGVTGAAVGAALAALTLQAVDGALPSAAVLVVPPAIIALCVVVVQTGTAFGTVRTALGAGHDAGRARTAASAGLTALVVLAAAFSLWRFLQYAGASGGVDVAAVAAPALALLAVALLGLLAFGPLARALDAVGSRARRVAFTLPARQVGRGLGFFTAPVALVILAVAATLLGAGYYGTWARLNQSAAQALNASDLRVQTALAAPVRSAADSVDAPGYATIPGIAAAVPALRASAQVGDTQLTVVGTSIARLGSIVGDNAAVLGAPGLGRTLSTPAVRGELALPTDTMSIAATMTATGDTVRQHGTVAVTIWLCDDDGELIPVTADAVPAAARLTTPRLSVPVAAGTWRVVAVDVTLAGGGTADADGWRLSGIRASQRSGSTDVPLADATGWSVVDGPFDTPPGVAATADGIGFTAPALDTVQGATVRLMPGAARRPAIAITTGFAHANDLGTRDAVRIDGGWWSLDATVADTVPMVPGERSPDAVLADLGTMERAVLRSTATPPAANQVWASAPDPDRALTAVQGRAGASATVTVADTAFVDRFLNSAFVGLALGCAGCIALAIIAIAAATAALSRRRRAEVAVFRALGFTAGQQASSRSAELWAIIAMAGVLGAAAGILVTFLIAPGLARLTVVTAPSSLPLSLVLDALAAAAGLAGTGAAVAVVILLYRAIVRHQAGDAEYREETR